MIIAKARSQCAAINASVVLLGLGQAVYIESEAWPDSPYDSESLYRELGPTKSRPLPVTLIPYHTWLNRGASQMTAWLPLD